LQASLGRTLPAIMAFNYPNIEALTAYLLRDVLALEPLELTRQTQAVARAADEPIAIIGLGCRFPGANDPDAFWQLLHEGIDAMVEVPPERWNVDDFYDPDPDAPRKMYTRYGGFLNVEVDKFDADFFG